MFCEFLGNYSHFHDDIRSQKELIYWFNTESYIKLDYLVYLKQRLKN